MISGNLIESVSEGFPSYFFIISRFITNSYLFEMIRIIIFTILFSELIHQVPKNSGSERPSRRCVFNPTLYLDTMSKCRR